MRIIKVTFSDGKTVEFNENQSFQTVVFNGEKASSDKVFTLESHHNLGLAAPFVKIVSQCKYFFAVENENVIYFSDSIIRVEEI